VFVGFRAKEIGITSLDDCAEPSQRVRNGLGLQWGFSSSLIS
jgi:hypothetical protein